MMRQTPRTCMKLKQAQLEANEKPNRKLFCQSI